MCRFFIGCGRIWIWLKLMKGSRHSVDGIDGIDGTLRKE
jgi:hypothetical protein